MKLKHLFISLILLSGISCNDSFLDKIPQDQLSDESFWKIKDDAVKYTTSIYRYFIDSGSYTIMLDCYTDNALPVHVFTNQGEISSGTATASTGHFKEVWQIAYRGIRRCNVFFDNISKVEMKEEEKEVLIGEVEFLRAYFHATLLKYYGGIPILTRTLALNEAIPARNTPEEVYTFIVDECDKAAQKLPLTHADNVGRATKGAALALKAHISYLMNEYETALASAKAVMDLEKYDLFNNYGNLFSADYENNCEVIFDIQYMENAKDYVMGSWIDQYYSPMMTGGWEALSPTQDLVNAYECRDGKPIQESKLYNPEKPYENRDPRLAFSILWHGCEFGGQTYSTKGTMGTGNATRTGYTMRKYADPDNKGNEYPGKINFILFRYAEMLLIYAETQNALNGPDASVYAAINKIRQRPSVELPPLPEGLSKEQMREAIRRERRIEFVFEGIHMFETRSWKTTEACVKKPAYGITYEGKEILIETRNFDPAKNYLWAIPLTEIDLSKGTLKQNPGY